MIYPKMYYYYREESVLLISAANSKALACSSLISLLRLSSIVPRISFQDSIVNQDEIA